MKKTKGAKHNIVIIAKKGDLLVQSVNPNPGATPRPKSPQNANKFEGNKKHKEITTMCLIFVFLFSLPAIKNST